MIPNHPILKYWMAINWCKLVVRVSKSPEFQTTGGQTLPAAVLEQVQLPGIPGLAASSWLWPWHWGHCWTWAIVILEQLQLLYHTVGSHFVYFCRASVRWIDDLLQHTVRFAYSIHSRFLAWPRDDVWLVSRQCLDVHQGCFPLFCSFTGMYDLTVGGNGNDYPVGPWATVICIYLLSRNALAIRKSRNFKPLRVGSTGAMIQRRQAAALEVITSLFKPSGGFWAHVAAWVTLKHWPLKLALNMCYQVNCFNSYNRTHKLTTTHHIVDLVKHILYFLCRWRTFSVPVWLCIWQAISTTRCAQQLWSRGPFHVWFMYDSYMIHISF